MRLLFAENVPPRPVTGQSDMNSGGRPRSTCRTVLTDFHRELAHAQDHGFTIVSKDLDFHEVSLLRGPPKVIWIRPGNYVTSDIQSFL